MGDFGNLPITAIIYPPFLYCLPSLLPTGRLRKQSRYINFALWKNSATIFNTLVMGSLKSALKSWPPTLSNMKRQKQIVLKTEELPAVRMKHPPKGCGDVMSQE